MSSKKKCYICSMRYQNDGGNLLDVSGFSDKTLLQVLENATCSSLEVTSTNLCDRCVSMLEAYEKYLLKVQSIQEKLNRFMSAKSDPAAEPEACNDDVSDNNEETKDLRKHKTARKPVKCSYCEKRFNSKKSLFIHSKLHNLLQEQNVICERCGGSFRNSKFLIHIEQCERQNLFGPFKCDDGKCTRKYEKYEAFMRHKKWHVEEEKRRKKGKASCDLCGKLFYVGSKMNRHMRVHTHRKAHGCPCCQKRYNSNWNLLQHIKQQHEDNYPSPNLFCCTYCVTTYKTVDKFRDHYEQVHEIYNLPGDGE